MFSRYYYDLYKLVYFFVLCAGVLSENAMGTSGSNIVTLSGKFGKNRKYGGFLLEREIDLNTLPKKDIVINAELTLDEAFNGKDMEFNLPVLLVNDQCAHVQCPLCNGFGLVYSNVHRLMKNRTLAEGAGETCLTVQTTTPCPLCRGIGLITQDNCNLYYQSNNVIKTRIDRGVRSGFVSILDGQGHERLEYSYVHTPEEDPEEDHASAEETADKFPGSNRWNDPQKRKLHNFIEFKRTRGAIEIHIKKLIVNDYMNQPLAVNNTPGYLISVNDDKIEIDVEMTAHQALNGFELEMPYINEKTLKISRKNKITFPGSNSTVPGLGLPKTRGAVGNYEESKIKRDDGQGFDADECTEFMPENLTDVITQVQDPHEYDDLLVRFHLLDLDGDASTNTKDGRDSDSERKMVYSEKILHDRREYKRIQSLCTDAMRPRFNVNVTSVNGKKTLNIGSTNGDDVVITGSFNAADFLQSSGMGLEHDNGSIQSTSHSSADIYNCTGADFDQYMLYKEDKKMRKLLLLLQKKREEEENAKR